MNDSATQLSKATHSLDELGFVAVRTMQIEPMRSVDALALLATLQSLISDRHPIEIYERIGIGTPTVAVAYHGSTLADVESLMAILRFADEIPQSWMPRGLRTSSQAQLRDSLQSAMKLNTSTSDVIGRVQRAPTTRPDEHGYALVLTATPDPADWSDTGAEASKAAAAIEEQTGLGVGFAHSIANSEPSMALALTGASLDEVTTADPEAVRKLTTLTSVTTTIWRRHDGEPLVRRRGTGRQT